ncbi:large ribosomal subunit protein uL23m-like [Babylonia areolata]|uniref:large ribosomal subunit protein uL23m-like n=1 Tax=Babylonia areolata TaxID=304850 RepID=UPI003FD15249
MATKLKGLQLLPLWRRRVPKYPVYWHGNPQLQVVMPHFWMKLVRPKRDIPNNQVRFIVHPQMSVIDIKNYLEKIYNVPVLDVRTKVMAGDDIKHPTRGHVVAKKDDYKVAFVQLVSL